MKDLGVHHYRFSLAWARLCPTGYCTVHDSIEGSGTNELGIQHYKDFIAKLKAADIEPFVTLYHWDLPQGLQDERGGWADTDADSELGINTAFKNYAKLCFESFGDNVKQWITFNEAQIVADLGYADGIFAPGIRVSHILTLIPSILYRLYIYFRTIFNDGEHVITRSDLILRPL